MKTGEYFKCQEVSETKNAGRVFNFLPSEVSCQPKLDGIRLQIHRAGDKVTIFSKSGKDVTNKFNELVEAAKQILNENFVLDGEGVYFHQCKINFNKILSKLKSGIGQSTFFGFDVLMIDGNDLTKEPYFTRRLELDKIQTNKHIRVTPQIITSDPVKLKDFYVESIKRGYEGIVYREIYSEYYSGLGSFVRKLKPLKTLDVQVVSACEKKAGYYSYEVKVKEGIICKVATRELLNQGQIIEVRHDGIIDSNNSLGKVLRFPSLFRIRNDVNEPNALGDKLES